MHVRIARVRPDADADIPLPRPMTGSSAGLDLAAANPEPMRLEPGEFRTIPTGLAMAIPPGYEGQVRPRSGLAARHGLTVLNSPGTIDTDYRGEVRVILINHGPAAFVVERGMRIAQLVIARVAEVAIEAVEALPATERGEAGFGSTGV